MLPGSDTAFLNERSLEHTTTVEAGLLCVIVPKWRLPPGYSVRQADLPRAAPRRLPRCFARHVVVRSGSGTCGWPANPRDGSYRTSPWTGLAALVSPP